jgi:hypothetical protein
MSDKPTKQVKPAVKRKPPAAGMGRKKGSVNKTTALLKDAILKAAEAVGDKEGKAGMVGYLTQQAKDNPVSFNVLLGKVLPLQIANDGDDTFKVTVIERVIRKAK